MDAHKSAASAQKAAKASLCVKLTRSRSTVERGTPAQWTVAAWIAGANVPDVIVRLVATPARVTPQFSFGCGSSDGTASCDLGEMNAKSARRQLQAQATVPVTVTGVTSVTLTVLGHADYLPKAPAASAKITVTTPASPTATATSQPTATTTPQPTAAPLPSITTTPLSVASLPSLPGPSRSLRPGGNAARLFPKLAPKSRAGGKATARQVADTSALPEGAPVAGAQIAGLAALALAFVLAVTRLSIRRAAPLSATPVTTTPVTTTPTGETEPLPAESAGTPDETGQSAGEE